MATMLRLILALSLTFTVARALTVPSKPSRKLLPPLASAKLRKSPNLVGSGQRLLFPGKPGKAYCLVSDPCVHVNALLAADEKDPSQTWVQGYGIRAGTTTLVIQAEGPFHAEKLPTLSFTADNNAAAKEFWNLHEASENGDLPKSSLGMKSLRVEDGGMGLGSVLITALDCDVRLLIFAKKGWTSEHPRLSLDVLDWKDLNAPHGIMGQIFPNRAKSQMFTSTVTEPSTRRSLRGALPGKDAKKEVDNHSAVGEAIRKLYSLKPATSILDGEPEDYLSTGAVEADCIFSRFRHEDKTETPRAKPWKPWVVL